MGTTMSTPAGQTSEKRPIICARSNGIAATPEEAPLDAIISQGGNAKEAKDYVKGAELYGKVCTMNPNSSAWAWFQRGFCLGRGPTGSDSAVLAEREMCYRKAIELDENLATAHFNLGVVLLKQGNLHGAEEAFRKAVELDPNDADAHINLGKALQARAKEETGGGESEAVAEDPRPSAQSAFPFSSQAKSSSSGADGGEVAAAAVEEAETSHPTTSIGSGGKGGTAATAVGEAEPSHPTASSGNGDGGGAAATAVDEAETSHPTTSIGSGGKGGTAATAVNEAGPSHPTTSSGSGGEGGGAPTTTAEPESSPTALLAQMDVALTAEEYAKAAQLCGKVCTLNPKNSNPTTFTMAQVWLNRGYCLAQGPTGSDPAVVAEEEECYRKAIELNPIDTKQSPATLTVGMLFDKEIKATSVVCGAALGYIDAMKLSKKSSSISVEIIQSLLGYSEKLKKVFLDTDEALARMDPTTCKCEDDAALIRLAAYAMNGGFDLVRLQNQRTMNLDHLVLDADMPKLWKIMISRRVDFYKRIFGTNILRLMIIFRSKAEKNTIETETVEQLNQVIPATLPSATTSTGDSMLSPQHVAERTSSAMLLIHKLTQSRKRAKYNENGKAKKIAKRNAAQGPSERTTDEAKKDSTEASSERTTDAAKADAAQALSEHTVDP